MPELAQPQPIREIAPKEQGGPHMHQGSDYQFDVTLGFCLDLLENPALVEVHCDSHDDISLIWHLPPDRIAEHIQNKSNEADWTVSKLCKREKKKPSIIERSLSHDKSEERAKFRFITSANVSRPLRCLTTPRDSSSRRAAEAETNALKVEINERLPEVNSPNHNDTGFWVDNMYWQTVNPKEAKLNNLLRIQDQLKLMGIWLDSKVVSQSFYPTLIDLIREASRLEWAQDPDGKVIDKARFKSHFETCATRLQEPSGESPDAVLERELQASQVPPDLILTAKMLRLRYVRDTLAMAHTSAEERQRVEAIILDTLRGLRLQVVANERQNGFPFYLACEEAINVIHFEVCPDTDAHHWRGFMYDVVSRGALRFL